MATLDELFAKYEQFKQKKPPKDNKNGSSAAAVIPEAKPTVKDPAIGEAPEAKTFEKDTKYTPALYDGIVKQEVQRYISDMQNKPNNMNFGNTNLALGGKFGNLNRKTAEDTLKYQRLVDRLNNRVYMKGQSLRPQVAGHGFSGVDAALNFDRYQMPKVETEETRQMINVRAWEDAMRKAEIVRQQGYQDLDLKTKQSWLSELIRKSGGMTDSDIRRYDKMYDEELHLYRMHKEHAYRKAFDEFSKLVTENLSRESAEIALNAWKNDPVTGAVLAELLKGVSTLPSVEQKAVGNALAERLRDNNLRGMSTADSVYDLLKYQGTLSMTASTAQIEALVEAVPGLADKIKEGGTDLWASITGGTKP
jgi:hypothetical protein